LDNEELNELAAKQYDADLEEIMRLPAGRRFMWGLLSQTRVFASSFHTNGSMVMMREGMRQVGLTLLRDVQQYPDLFMAMWNENVELDDFTPSTKAGIE
jgi:hypothetical protein